MRQKDGRIIINPLTAALEFVSITRSSTEVRPLVAETVAGSFSGTGGSCTQLELAESDLILIAHLRYRLRSFKFPRHEQTTPGETSGRHSSQ